MLSDSPFGNTIGEHCTEIILPPNIKATTLRAAISLQNLSLCYSNNIPVKIVCEGAEIAKQIPSGAQQIFETTDRVIRFNFIIA